MCDEEDAAPARGGGGGVGYGENGRDEEGPGGVEVGGGEVRERVRQQGGGGGEVELPGGCGDCGGRCWVADREAAGGGNVGGALAGLKKEGLEGLCEDAVNEDLGSGKGSLVFAEDARRECIGGGGRP